MDKVFASRRDFLRSTGLAAGALLFPKHLFAAENQAAADYTVRIKAAPIEIAPKLILSTTTYNGQFPGPLLRFKEGQPVTIDIVNDTSAPEQLHWHGQMVPVDVDGAAEEGTPYVPAHGERRIVFTPRPRAYGSITRTTVPGRICLREPTVGRLDLSISRQRTSLGDTIAKSFSR